MQWISCNSSGQKYISEVIKAILFMSTSRWWQVKLLDIKINLLQRHTILHECDMAILWSKFVTYLIWPWVFPIIAIWKQNEHGINIILKSNKCIMASDSTDDCIALCTCTQYSVSQSVWTANINLLPICNCNVAFPECGTKWMLHWKCKKVVILFV